MPTDFWRNDISGSLSPLKKTWQQEEHHIMKLGMRPLSTMTLVWCTRHTHRAGHLQVCFGFCRRRCSPALSQNAAPASFPKHRWQTKIDDSSTQKICRTCIQARHDGMRHRCTSHTVRALEVQTLLVARTTIVSCQARRWPGTKCRSFMILIEPGHSKLDFQRLLCSRRKENINLEGHVLRREVRHTAPTGSCPTCHVQSAKVCWILTHRALPRRNALVSKLQKIYVPNWHTALVHSALLEEALVTREIQRMHAAEVNWPTHGLQSFMLALKFQKLFCLIQIWTADSQCLLSGGKISASTAFVSFAAAACKATTVGCVSISQTLAPGMTYPPYAFAALTSRVFNGPSSDRSVSKWLQQCQNHVGHIFEDTQEDKVRNKD